MWTRRPIVALLPCAAYIAVRELLFELVFGSAADWFKDNLGLFGDFIAWRGSTPIIAFALVIVVVMGWSLLDRWGLHITGLASRQPRISGLTGDLTAMHVEARGFEGIHLQPNGYGWLIPSVTITNPTGDRMKVDATLVIGERRLPAARAEETVETKVRPPRSRESRLSVPADVPSRDAIHGSLVFVMPAAAYRNLPPEVKSTLSLATKVLEVRDLLSEAVERTPMPPENQTIVASFPVLPQPNFYHKLRRRLRAAWKRLAD